MLTTIEQLNRLESLLERPITKESIDELFDTLYTLKEINKENDKVIENIHKVCRDRNHRMAGTTVGAVIELIDDLA